MTQKKKEDSKILLIQIREDEMADHEAKIIIENSGLLPENFVLCNVVKDDPVPLENLSGYDAVIMGGAGGFSVLHEEPFMPYLRDVARYCKENDIPFLGLCFGFQIAVQAFGGTVINDKENMEIGTYMMYRTDDSDSDPLIGDLPKQFTAGCGRKDRASVLPPRAVNYLYSDRSPYNYITFSGTRFFATQFHPELWKKSDNLIRINHYKEKYTMTEEEFQEQIKMFEDAPESRFVIRNFVENVVLKKPF